MRNMGSTVLAGTLATGLFVFGIWLVTGHKIDWTTAQPWVDGGSCLVLCVVLGVWINTGFQDGHNPKSLMKVGNESITMVATVLAAILAVLAFTDTAVSNATKKQPQLPPSSSSSP